MTATKEMTDRELDALIAERLMGIEVYQTEPRPIAWKWLDRSKSFRDESNREVTQWSKPYFAIKGTNDEAVPLYSHYIADAMLVVEKMRERGFDISMKHSEWTDNKRRWLVEFDAGGAGDAATYRNADGDSLPRAICEAALSAGSASDKE